ncbi:PaaI family thioesterase, partial [Mesorhizobium sp. M2D.F.Ca.ET.145.01.1.1]
AYTTAEFKVNLTRPITPRTGEVVCEGKVVHKGRTLAVSEATLKDAGGKLLAFGTETCSIFPAANLAAR